jgi:hypothetical protein
MPYNLGVMRATSSVFVTSQDYVSYEITKAYQFSILKKSSCSTC